MQNSYLPGELIREVRKRKGYRQSHFQEAESGVTDSQTTLSRIENLRQNPSRPVLTELLSAVELPYRQFFCPYMENQSSEAFAILGRLRFLLGRAEGDQEIQRLAREQLEQLRDMLDFDSIINRQLWIAYKVRLDLMKGGAGEETLTLINEGLRLTYPEFDENSFNGDVLIFHEWSLMLSLVRYHAGTGDLDHARSILIRLREGYEKNPISEMHKEAQLNEIYNLTAQLLLESGDAAGALAANDRALLVAKKMSGNSLMPHTIYARGMILYRLTGDQKQSLALLRQAYFAFAALKMTAMQQRVLNDARETLHEDFNTFFTEGITLELPADFYEVRTGGALPADNIGELLRQFRQAAGVSQADVYRGICSRSFYSRIESGERTNVSVFILEALMQRLGRDMNRYVEYFSSLREWEEERLRMQYMRELYIGNVEEARQTMGELEKVGDFESSLGRQFLLSAQARMERAHGDTGNYLSLMHEALRMTRPDYTEEGIADLRLTYYECNIINAIANYYAEHGETERGVAIYLRLRESMNRFYVDDSVKARYYLTLLSNLALEHYNLGLYEEALAFARECESSSLWYDLLFMLNEIMFLKAMCLNKLGRHKKAVQCAALGYYSGALSAREEDLRGLEDFAREELGLDFSGGLGYVYHTEKAGTYSGESEE